MKKCLALLLTSLFVIQAHADYYLAGDFTYWFPDAKMTQTAPGIWQYSLWLGANRYNYRVTDGTWNWTAPVTANSWAYTGQDGIATFTYDSNTYNDGWSTPTGRIIVEYDPGKWTAVGDWQGWYNENPATAMVSQGGGIYKYSQTLSPGTHQYKAVVTGSWDAIGADNRSVNAASLTFNTTEESPVATFWVNAINGTVKVTTAPVPEPSSTALISVAFAGLFLWMRRKY